MGALISFGRGERCLLFTLGFVAVVCTVSLSLWRELALSETRFLGNATQAAVAFDQAVAEGTTLMSALYGFYHSSGEMPAERFPVLIESFLSAHPQLGWAGYATRVDDDEVASFEQHMSEEGFINFKIWKPKSVAGNNANNPYQLPVNMLEPLSPISARGLGRDLLAHPGWRERILDSIARSMVVAIYSRNPAGEGEGYLLVRPTFKGTVEPKTTSERQRQLAGLILIFLRSDRLAALATQGHEDLEATIIPRPTPTSSPLQVDYLSITGFNQVNMTVEVPVKVPDQTAYLMIHGRPHLAWTGVAGPILATFAVLGIMLFTLQVRRQSEVVKKASIERALIAEVTLSSVGDAVVRTNQSGLVHYMNPTARKLLGSERAPDTPHHFNELFDCKNRAGLRLDWSRFKAAVHNGERLWLRTARGGEHVVSCNMTEVMSVDDADGEEFVLALRDVTVEFELAQELEHHARYDPLTKLPNRRDFDRQLRDMVAGVSSRTITDRCSVLYLDLDQFKLVNDTCGHAAGDQMLSQLAGMLASVVHAPNVLARLGGDEFGVLVRSERHHDSTTFAQLLCDTVAAYRFVWEERIFELGVSVGVVHLSPRSGTAEDVLRAADLACFAAKDLGRNRFHVYRQDDRVIARNEGEMLWQEEVKRALSEKRLILHGQPIYPLRQEVRHPSLCEVLVRMHTRDGSLAPPMSFIPAAERYGLMGNLDQAVIRLAFEHVARDTRGHLIYNINLSGQSMADKGLGDYVLHVAAEMSVEPSLICFEVTETSAISNLNSARKLMFRLRDKGFRFALDDFGAGLSSFRYLKQLPVNYLKIDGQFIKGIDSDRVAQTMVSSIVQVANELNVRTIGEMVENEAARVHLLALGVDYAQGFYLGEPVRLARLYSVAKTA